MERIKEIYWEMRSDAPDLWFWFLSRLPGYIGIRLRSFFIRPVLGKCGRNVMFHMNVRIVSPKGLKIGSHCVFSEGVFLTAGGGIVLGDYVAMGPDVKVWSVNHRFEDPDQPWMKQGYEHKEVVIEDDVWLGANTFVKPGVHIGKGAIISAGTVLSKSVPAFAIVAGNPGRVVGWRKQPEGAAPERARAGAADEAGA